MDVHLPHGPRIDRGYHDDEGSHPGELQRYLRGEDFDREAGEDTRRRVGHCRKRQKAGYLASGPGSSSSGKNRPPSVNTSF